jgi:hypothetical protein
MICDCGELAAAHAIWSKHSQTKRLTTLQLKEAN